MALELVTSKTGAFHVDSADDRLLHARTMGGGNYVLYGCECTMTTANKLHIAEGEMLLQGGFVRITNGGEDVTITNGSQGQKRNTLVCFDWTKGAQDIEATSLVAINGANTTGTPADPSYAEGDMNSGDTHVQIPICRITLDGLTVGDPVVLLDDFESISSLRETISQIFDFESEEYVGTEVINQATNARILTDHNSSNSIVKVFGIIGTGTNALQRAQVPGLFDASGRQIFGVKTKIHFDVDSACMFEYVGVYSSSTSGSNVNGFFNDSASIGIGADGFVYIAPSSDSSSIPGNSNEWVFFNIPLILC